MRQERREQVRRVEFSVDYETDAWREEYAHISSFSFKLAFLHLSFETLCFMSHAASFDAKNTAPTLFSVLTFCQAAKNSG